MHSAWFTGTEAAVSRASESKKDAIIEERVQQYVSRTGVRPIEPAVRSQGDEAKFNEAQHVVRQLIFVIDCNLPLSIVRKRTWRAMFPPETWVVRKSSPSSTITQLTLCKQTQLSRRLLERMIPMLDELALRSIRSLVDGHVVSLSTDAWTATNLIKFLGVNVHTFDTKRQVPVVRRLAFIELTRRATAEELRSQLAAALELLGVDVFVLHIVSDGAANIRRVRELSDKSQDGFLRAHRRHPSHVHWPHLQAILMLLGDDDDWGWGYCAGHGVSKCVKKVTMPSKAVRAADGDGDSASDTEDDEREREPEDDGGAVEAANARGQRGDVVAADRLPASVLAKQWQGAPMMRSVATLTRSSRKSSELLRQLTANGGRAPVLRHTIRFNGDVKMLERVSDDVHVLSCHSSSHPYNGWKHRRRIMLTRTRRCRRCCICCRTRRSKLFNASHGWRLFSNLCSDWMRHRSSFRFAEHDFLECQQCALTFLTGASWGDWCGTDSCHIRSSHRPAQDARPVCGEE